MGFLFVWPPGDDPSYEEREEQFDAFLKDRMQVEISTPEHHKKEKELGNFVIALCSFRLCYIRWCDSRGLRPILFFGCDCNRDFKRLLAKKKAFIEYRRITLVVNSATSDRRGYVSRMRKKAYFIFGLRKVSPAKCGTIRYFVPADFSKKSDLVVL